MYNLVPKRKTNFFLILSIIILFVIVVSQSGCSEKIEQKQITQGLIQFDINYINLSEKKFPLQLMPKTLKLIFNKDFSCYTIEDRVGVFSIKNILNYKENRHTTLIKIFDKKYVYYGLPKENTILFDSISDYTSFVLKDTMRLAGFLCKKAIITDHTSNSKFDIFFTNDIEIENPNKCTPYESVSGMLLFFRLHLKSLYMELKARNFEHKIIKNEEFLVPEDCKQISRNQMEDIITTILP